MKRGQKLSETVLNYIKERSQLEQEYAKRLQKIQKSYHQNIIPDCNQTVILQQSSVLLKEQADNTLDFSKELVATIEQPLIDFISAQKSCRKTLEARILELSGLKKQQEQNVLKLEDKCKLKTDQLKDLKISKQLIAG